MKERVEKILELDKRRTQGKWDATGYGIYCDNDFIIQNFANISDLYMVEKAPEMAAIIRELWTENKLLEEELYLSGEALISARATLKENGFPDLLFLDEGILNIIRENERLHKAIDAREEAHFKIQEWFDINGKDALKLHQREKRFREALKKILDKKDKRYTELEGLPFNWEIAKEALEAKE